MTGIKRLIFNIAVMSFVFVMLLAFSTLGTKVEILEKQAAQKHQYSEVVVKETNPLEALALELVNAPNETEPGATEPEPESLGTFCLTAYCACPACCGEWADGYTYTGTVATAGRTIAVDPDVIPLGSSVLINSQEYIAEDIGGAIQGDRIDIFFDSHADALEFGIQYAEVSTVK